jgi:hypothetical protein
MERVLSQERQDSIDTLLFSICQSFQVWGAKTEAECVDVSGRLSELLSRYTGGVVSEEDFDTQLLLLSSVSAMFTSGEGFISV